MASERAVSRMLEIFSNLWTRKQQIDDGAIKSYSLALKSHTDEMIADAAERCLRECTRFPAPVDIIQRMDRRANIIASSDEDFYIYDHQSCEQCGKRDVMCIKEPKEDGVWQCRECYTDLSAEEFRFKIREIASKIQGMSLNREIGHKTEAEQKARLNEQKKQIEDGDIPF